MKKLTISFMLLLLLILVAVGCSTESSGSQQSSKGGNKNSEKTIKLTVSTALLEGAAQSKGLRAWAEELEKRTNGKVKIEQISYGGVAMDAASTLEGLKDGIVDVAFISNAYNPSKTPLTNALQPVFLEDLATSAADIQKQLWEEMPELQEEWRKYNVEPVAWFNGSNNVFMSNFEFDKLEDLKGKRIRGLGEADSLAAKNLGGVPVQISSADAYGALEKGTVDVVPFPPYALLSNKMAEVSKQVTDFRHNGAFMWFGIAFNGDVYSSLPDDVKKVIAEISSLPSEVEHEAYFNDAIEGLKLARENDVRIVQLSPEEASRWQKAINPPAVWEPAIKAAEAAGYKDVRKKVEEARKLLEEYHKKNPSKTIIEEFLEMEEKGEL
ncbi:TRAP transporter substrate-binding protein DctP [Neobacillus niacini]|uniref:TRAP transporter substrate-binding protein DctP n=1 Tax=Neobacillus niacini TaxID=86668 RepID=UPI0021CB0AF5|nr:TRAP transporter substrate-binding protein DctP [Neobacillus niacini]MCM3766183.1 TRAP transporter substrate-binding protein DctP [Neobacillus niacini]